MKVSIPKFSGFCPGVMAAEKRIFKQKESLDKNIYILGQLIHNKNYIRHLSELGILTVDEIKSIPENELTVIRTHGIDIEVEKQILENHPILDLTCFKVKILQKLIKSYSDKGYFIIISGKREHPEVRGLISYARHSFVIQDEAALKAFTDNKNDPQAPLKNSGCKKIFIVSQTTAPLATFETIRETVREILSNEYIIEDKNTICSITSSRESKALELQQKTDITFVIGDEKSSNANKLYRNLKTANDNTYFIEDIDHLKSLNLPLSGMKSAQVVSSSSTPKFVENEVIEYLESID